MSQVNVPPELLEKVKALLQEAKIKVEKAKELKERPSLRFLACDYLARAVNDCLVALAMYYSRTDTRLRSILEGSYELTSREYEMIAVALRDHMGDLPVLAWDAAFLLYLMGFRNDELGRESIEARIPIVEKLIEEAFKVTDIKPEIS